MSNWAPRPCQTGSSHCGMQALHRGCKQGTGLGTFPKTFAHGYASYWSLAWRRPLNPLTRCIVQERAKEEKAAYTAKLAGGGGGDDGDAGDDAVDDADDAGGDSD